MKQTTFTNARHEFNSVLDDTTERDEPIIIRRRRKSDAVVMSLKHYNELKAMASLIEEPIDTKRLAQSIAELEAKQEVGA
ncbi:type II toxin-antitoxin system Phd/YefM family antitoxin [Vibrio owensii]|uniref:type II toxin-antitoxin system Phd/YefM family antitoxin n=1 Tax=Vibrio owensii TaxID=696485 RepID=UPI0018F17B8C|nr:type II toxin-antitoxin system prevent-host-death family antitoxin [Vibrio owensii]